jgi:hypothetical protein
MVRRVVCMVLLLAACSGGAEPTGGSSGGLPEPSEPDTLLPVPNDTQPPDVTDSFPPDALFGGDVCTALTEDEIARVSIDGRGAGRVTDVAPLSEDSCRYLVKVGSREYDVIVQVQSPSDFLNPGGTDEVVDELDGPGLAARGVTHVTETGEEYEVIVKVENGFFSVTTPDQASATTLATKAEPRANP